MATNLNIQKIKVPKTLIVKDREKFIVDYCSGKSIVHIGCVGTREFEKKSLHENIHDVSKNLVGLDFWEDGIRSLKKKNPNLNLLNMNAEELDDKQINFKVDSIIMGEVIEHMGNPKKALESAKKLMNRDQCKLLISVPNAFGLRNISSMLLGHTEITRLDHYCYYSYVTMRSLLRDVGMKIDNHFYYSLLSNKKGISYLLKYFFFNSFLYRLRPGLAEGIIFEVSNEA